MQGPRSENRPMADINVTPLVDVILVLLIIFMVTAPMMQQGVDVELPQTTSKAMEGEERLVVTINAKSEVYLNQEKVDPALLRRHLERSTAARLNREVFLRADRSVPYGFVVRIMAEIKNAGIEKLGMVT